MNRQQQIDAFVAQAHLLATQRLPDVGVDHAVRAHAHAQASPAVVMKRSEVEHVLRAAAAIAQETSFVICPEVHDLVISTGVAGREKNADFVRALSGTA